MRERHCLFYTFSFVERVRNARLLHFGMRREARKWAVRFDGFRYPERVPHVRLHRKNLPTVRTLRIPARGRSFRLLPV